ncbi:MAG: hypothetical protein ACKVP0_16005 [Pirellulaceae bacterium]
MRATSESGRLASFWLRFLAAWAILGIAGCGSSTKGGPPTPQPAAVGSTNGASTNAKTSTTTISPELVQKVNDLVRLHKEYAAMSKGVQTFDDFKKQSDALSSLEQQLSSLVEDIMIAEAKLSAAEKAEFDSKYYLPAKPAIEEQRREKQRIQGLIR